MYLCTYIMKKILGHSGLKLSGWHVFEMIEIWYSAFSSYDYSLNILLKRHDRINAPWVWILTHNIIFQTLDQTNLFLFLTEEA